MYSMFVIFWYRTSRKVDWFHDSEFPRPCWAPFVGHAASSPFIRGRSWPWAGHGHRQSHCRDIVLRRRTRKRCARCIRLACLSICQCSGGITCKFNATDLQFGDGLCSPFLINLGWMFIVYYWVHYIRLDVACCYGIWQLRYKQVRTEGKTEELNETTGQTFHDSLP